MDRYGLYKEYIKELGHFDPVIAAMSAEEVKDIVESYEIQVLTDWIDIASR